MSVRTDNSSPRHVCVCCAPRCCVCDHVDVLRRNHDVLNLLVAQLHNGLHNLGLVVRQHVVLANNLQQTRHLRARRQKLRAALCQSHTHTRSCRSGSSSGESRRLCTHSRAQMRSTRTACHAVVEKAMCCSIGSCR